MTTTVDEARAEKVELARAILSLVEQYEQTTGVRVTNISFDCYLEYQPIATRYVDVEVKL